MIQRIQSLYLITCVILAILAFFGYTLAIEANSGQIFYIDAGKPYGDTANNVLNVWPYPVLLALGAVLSLISLFLYKNRGLQIRLCSLSIILYLGVYAVLAFYVFFQLDLDINTEHYTTQIKILWPFFNAILSYLAVRAIIKDEVLVRSVNRLR